MTEEEVFLTVLDLPSAAHRNAYLDKVCGADAALRQQVEELLAAHFKSGEFLDVPFGQQLRGDPLGTDSAIPAIAETVYLTGNPKVDAVANEEKPDDDFEDLHFLEPSALAGSLGRIDHYEVLQVLGKGGFGIVLGALDDVLQRVVALKVLAPAIARTSPARKRFLREAVASARVRHENVVQIHAVEELPIPYLVMEFIAGETLQQRLDRKGPLEAAEIVSLGRQIAEGLAAAHATGLIHRDIKPGNILIEGGSSERVKITDFGLARAADDASMTQSGMVAGTPMFMAPEQVQGEVLDQRADLFSLGSVLYVMTCGRPPFRAATTFAVLKRVVEEEPRPIADLIPETPQWLCDIISRLHAKNPADRYQSSREVADLLADCEERLKTNPHVQDFPRITRGNAAPPRARSSASVGAWKWPAAAVVSLFVVIGALAATEFTGVTQLFRESAKRDEVVVDADLVPVASAAPVASDRKPVADPAPLQATSPAPAAHQALRDALVEKKGFLDQIVQEHLAGTKSELDVIYARIDLSEARIHLAGAERDAAASIAAYRRLVSLREQERSLVEQQVQSGQRQADDLERSDSGLVDARGRLAKALAEAPSSAFFSEADIRRIAALPAGEQVEEVRKELQRRNPDLDGSLTPTIENDVVTGLAFNTDQVDDISPVRALARLTSLDCRGTYRDKGRLSDLSPLKGMSLTWLDCSSTQVADLTPLAGMPLTYLQFNHNPVSSLAPLKGMPLVTLGCAETQVADLSPLKGMKLRSLGAQLLPVTDLSPLQGMPLTGLDLYHTIGVTDLTPLQGMPLDGLNLHDVPANDLSPLAGMTSLRTLLLQGTKVSDLSPLRGLKLTTLLIRDKQVTDLSPLQGMPLVRLEIFGAGVSDLSPLQGMPLQGFRFTPQGITQGLDVLRDMPTLQTIGTGESEVWPAAEFWERYEKGEFKE